MFRISPLVKCLRSESLKEPTGEALSAKTEPRIGAWWICRRISARFQFQMCCRGVRDVDRFCIAFAQAWPQHSSSVCPLVLRYAMGVRTEHPGSISETSMNLALPQWKSIRSTATCLRGAGETNFKASWTPQRYVAHG